MRPTKFPEIPVSLVGSVGRHREGHGEGVGSVGGRGEGQGEGVGGHGEGQGEGVGSVGGVRRGVGYEEGLSFCSETLPTELTQRSRALQGFRGRPQEAAGAVGPLGQDPSPSQFLSYLSDPQA